MIKIKGLKLEHNNTWLLMLVFYFVLILDYYALCDYRSDFEFVAQPTRIVFTSLLVVGVIRLSYRIRDDFLCFIYNIVFGLIFSGEAVYYQFTVGSRIECLLGSTIFMLMLVITQNVNFKVKTVLTDGVADKLLIVLVFLLFIPYAVLNFRYININNLFLRDIYTTRMLYREMSTGRSLMGYIVPVLSRIVLPFLISESVMKKKRVQVVVFTIMALFLFLCGALKSMLFGVIATLIFIPGSYKDKVRNFFWIVTVGGLIGYIGCFFDNHFVIDYIRRLFFVPATLENVYVTFFDHNFTYMSHSKLTFGLLDNKYGSSLSMYIGENVIGLDGLNANIGVLLEGFISFGLVGILLFGLIMSLMFQFFKSLKIKPFYAGIFFVYVYCMNTAFLHNLLIGHGLLFLLVFSFLFMQNREPDSVE